VRITPVTPTAGPDESGPPRSHRFGFACLVGRPNAGKSTLTNALVGEKVAITSSRPQTTRHSVRGIITRPDSQLVLIDTPGLHKPRTLLGNRLNAVVRETWAGVDLIVMCIPADEAVGRGDEFIASEISEVRRTVRFAVVTKTDLVDAGTLAQRLTQVAALGQRTGVDWSEIVPVCAVDGFQTRLLTDLLMAQLPEGPAMYPDGDLTDEPQLVMIGELIREAALEGARDELPHSIAVVVEEMALREGRPADRPLADVHAVIYVERPSQKSIVIGTGGARLKAVGTQARSQIERLLGTPVYLDLRVKVAKDWQRDPKALNRLGF